MAINEITGNNSIPLSDLGRRLGPSFQRAPFQPVGVDSTSEAGAADQIVNAAQENVQQSNTPQQNANVANQAAAPERDAILQNILLINETLRNLNFISDGRVNPVLTNQISPTIAATDILGDLDIIQQSAQVINETLLNLGIELPFDDTVQALTAAAPQNVTITSLELEPARTTAVPAAVQPPAADPNLIEQDVRQVNTPQQNISVGAPAATPDRDAILQNVLLISETLQSLNFVSDGRVNPVLINQIPPNLAAADILRDLDIIQQNAQVINETLLNLGIELPFDNTVQPLTAAAPENVPITSLETQPATTTAVPAAAQPPAADTNQIDQDIQQLNTPQQNINEAAPPATPDRDAILQNALQINETLRNLNFISDGRVTPLLINQISPTLDATDILRDLDIIQQSALLINETLQNLNFISDDRVPPLLINQIPPDLEAADLLDDLDILQQNALLINEALQNLGLELPFEVTAQPLLIADQEVTVIEEEIDATLTTAALQNVNSPLGETEPVTTTAAPAAAQPPTLPTPTVDPAVVTIPLPATFLTQELTPATLPVTLYPDRTPYVHVVYRLNNPTPLPDSPEPINREVLPTTPVVSTQPVGDARLRQLLRSTGELGKTRDLQYTSSPPTILQTEKSIRFTLNQINSDMAAQGLPLHLVFAKHEGGLALDVYDCSYNDACVLSYDIPISIDNLMGVLGNLDHETGIIVDTTS